jgi:hypothetical protein
MGPIQKRVEVDVVDVAGSGWDVCRSYCDGSLLGIYCDC